MPFLIVIVTGRRVDPDGSPPNENHFGMPDIERLSAGHLDAERAKWLRSAWLLSRCSPMILALSLRCEGDHVWEDGSMLIY